MRQLALRQFRDSLPEPDRFRLQYRDALIEVVGEIIRRGLKPTAEEIVAPKHTKRGSLSNQAYAPQ
jgi:hypothetical protein